MIRRPDGMGTFEFVAVASLRAAQLMRGCAPRVTEDHTTAITAQLEVAGGKVAPIVNALPLPDDPKASPGRVNEGFESLRVDPPDESTDLS